MIEDRFKKDFIRVGNNIQKYRKAMGLSQEKFAEKVNISRGYLSQIEAATEGTSITLHMLLIIAEGLEVEPGKLLE